MIHIFTSDYLEQFTWSDEPEISVKSFPLLAGHLFTVDIQTIYPVLYTL